MTRGLLLAVLSLHAHQGMMSFDQMWKCAADVLGERDVTSLTDGDVRDLCAEVRARAIELYA